MNNSNNQLIYDFSNLTANEVEVETSERNVETKSNKCISKAEKPFFDTFDYKNGALFDELNYCWSQSFSEIEIHVRLPESVSSKNLKVNITNTSIDVSYHSNGQQKRILNGTLYEKCKASDAMWTITEGKKLNISFDKIKQIWWKKLLQHETEIDVSQIDCSRPMEELPEETQTEIHQIQYDEQLKLKGQLTSEQLKQHELLQKAWNAEGSPFKGQPFDPNIVQFQND